MSADREEIFTDPASVACPHAGCDGTIRIPTGLPEGTYPCICHAINVQLTWGENAKLPVLELELRPA